ncbi:leucine-rich repeat-containing protein 37A-like [Acipenser oxyrinchus oxyrinchus]|uniref:Leucine-rich repeat-containing protein 37A-like n=1 Tax=Acipenser oxyrinchus oxyrinchus TaxID=40147 RepID=A0AAD8LN80_ACIOX|nr:leucine-rich repeat-containing protein 37A-like [Acipenser oxyrinchus oxyrinchus]
MKDKGLKLKNIPTLDSAVDFTILDFRGNSISKLKGAIWAQYQNAVYLNLKHNNLTEVNKLSFAGLFKLKYLFLSDNQIMFMTSYAFEPLLHIQLIDLSNNQLIGIQDDLFKSNSGFPNLKVLDLSNNHIVTIGCDAFGMLSQLSFLNMSGNDLDFIGDRAFENMTSLTYLDIHTSHISIKTLGVILHKKKGVINLYLSHATKCCLCMFPSHTRFYLSRTLELDCKDLKCEITLKKCYPNEENSLQSVRPSCNPTIPEKTPNMNESKSLFRNNDFNSLTSDMNITTTAVPINNTDKRVYINQTVIVIPVSKDHSDFKLNLAQTVVNLVSSLPYILNQLAALNETTGKTGEINHYPNFEKKKIGDK